MLHIIVPAVGITEDNKRWRSTRYKNFLFPVNVVKRLFQGKFLALFKQAVTKGDIAFHGTLAEYEQKPVLFRKLIDTLYKKEWVVYLKPPFAGSEAVLKYLGRYTHRIALANSRIIEMTESTVSFRWKDYRDGDKVKIMTLAHTEFIRRFLLHVLPKGFVRIRYYGFLGQAVKKEQLRLCKELLGEGVKTEHADCSQNNEQQQSEDTIIVKHWRRCPQCNAGMMVKCLVIRPPYQRNVERAAVA